MNKGDPSAIGIANEIFQRCHVKITVDTIDAYMKTNYDPDIQVWTSAGNLMAWNENRTNLESSCLQFCGPGAWSWAAPFQNLSFSNSKESSNFQTF
jgi:hypothetical protein